MTVIYIPPRKKERWEEPWDQLHEPAVQTTLQDIITDKAVAAPTNKATIREIMKKQGLKPMSQDGAESIRIH